MSMLPLTNGHPSSMASGHLFGGPKAEIYPSPTAISPLSLSLLWEVKPPDSPHALIKQYLHLQYMHTDLRDGEFSVTTY